MEIKGTDSPFYLRLGITVLTIAILAAALYLGRGIFVPFFFGVLLATLLLPVVKFLSRRRVGKVLSILIPVIVSMGIIGTIVYFLSTQIGAFLADIPALEAKSKELLWHAQQWVYHHFSIGFTAQEEYIAETTENMDTQGMVSKTVLSITGAISYLVFMPTYAFLLLYHKEMIKKFLIAMFRNGESDKVQDVLYESQNMSQQYITGLLTELCIVLVLNTAGFLLLGIKYPIFLALLAAILNIVPYIGMIIANIICAMVTLVSNDDPINVIWVAAILAGVQIIDNNILMPMIVGTKVRLNAIAIIIGVLVSGALGGIAAMFLAIPALAVLKIIFDKVDHLKPWAMLLGDETTIEEEEKRNPVKRAFSRVRTKSHTRGTKPRVS